VLYFDVVSSGTFLRDAVCGDSSVVAYKKAFASWVQEAKAE
jgi:hypothetical protein